MLQCLVYKNASRCWHFLGRNMKQSSMGELSEAFQIETGDGQENGQPPFMFKCVLDQVVQERRKQQVGKFWINSSS